MVLFILFIDSSIIDDTAVVSMLLVTNPPISDNAPAAIKARPVGIATPVKHNIAPTTSNAPPIIFI